MARRACSSNGCVVRSFSPRITQQLCTFHPLRRYSGEKARKFEHYKNGKWIDSQDTSIPAVDLSFLRGYGVFDFLRVYNGLGFRLSEHIDRFIHTAELMKVPVATNLREEVHSVVQEGINRNSDSSKDLYVKLFLTGGESDDAITISKPSLLVTFLPTKTYPLTDSTEGIKMITYRHERFLPAAKSTNYMAGVLAVKEAKANDAVDALFVTNDGKFVLEGTTMNFFGIKDNKLWTPPLGKILKGITRQHTLQIAKRVGMEIVEEDFPMSALSSIDEAFVTSTTREITPLVRIDSQTVGNGKVGDKTKKLMEAFKESTKEPCFFT